MTQVRADMQTEVKRKKGKRKRSKRSKRSIFLTIAISVFSAYVIAVFIGQQVQIGDKKEELATLTQQLQVQNLKNEEIKKSLDTDTKDNSDYIERLARTGLDFVKPGERVFVNVAGS